MGARITELILRREMALSLLARANQADIYVRAAIEALNGEPPPGISGGPARDYKLVNDLTSREPPVTPQRTRRHIEPFRPPSGRDDTGFTSRQRDILGLIASGMTNAQIGQKLFISTDTVKTHIAQLLNECDVTNRAALVTVARDRGVA